MWYGKDTKSRFIPPWLFQNVIHQLVFPKISEAVDICTDKDVVRIHLWLFPWLPLLGSELDFLWSEIRRKIEHLFKNQPFINPIIFDTISIWNPVFSESDMQHLAKSVIIPGIISQLSLLQIDPQNQDVSMLQATFQWQPFLPAHQLSLIFETEFFPKWHTALWSWITFPHARLDEISQWYCHWKTFLAEAGLASLDSVKKGFSIGLDMMNQGLSLTPGSTPVFVGSSAKAPVASITDNQLTFLDLVQLSCADANVDFVPLNRRHANGRAMYKLGLLTVYLENGVMFVNGPGGYTPSSIEAAILRSGM